MNYLSETIAGGAKWRDRPMSVGSFVIALLGVVITDICFIMSSKACEHWFMIPVSVCGVIVGTDAVNWLRDRLDRFDPFGVIGLLGVHYFYVAPLLHVKWDLWTMPDATPADWRDWLGYMGILNAVGLILYVWGRSFVRSKPDSAPTVWKAEPRKMRLVMPVLIGISAVAQVAVYAHFGGVSGYIETRFADPAAMTGFGPLFLVSESAPILTAFFFILRARDKRVHWASILTGLVILFALQMYFGGLRGSRSETVQLFFWVIGCVHFMLRPISRSFVAGGLVVFTLFMYVYGFYKTLGKDATQAITASSEDRAYFATKSNRTASTLVLADLARADVQAFILFRLVQDGRDFSYAMGRTYLGALALLVPKSILPNRPYTKLKEGTEIQTGETYDPENFSSKVYGLSGEAMLNFGPLATPVCYGIFGYLVARFKRFIASLNKDDVRLLLAPIGVYMCVGVLNGDADNNVFGLAKNLMLPFIALALSSVRLKRSSARPRLPEPGFVPAQQPEMV